MATKEVIEKYYDCANRGAWNDWLTLFTDDVTGDEQLAGHFEGIAVLRGAINAISYGYSKFQMIPLHIVMEGDQAAVIWRCEAANRAGTPIAYNYLPGVKWWAPIISAWRVARLSTCGPFTTKRPSPPSRIRPIPRPRLPRGAR